MTTTDSTAPVRTDASVRRTLDLLSTGARPGSSCSPDLTAGPWTFDAGAPGYGPGASQQDAIPAGAPRQGALPQEYQQATDAELHERIRAAKAELGDRVVVLGHFYQRDEVVAHADFVGDSFQLAKAARTRPEAEAIVFCGVHFMAETADLLSTE
ncbi:MAG TPA: quinolinate synthase NadA, partial [Citricoccus sp.]